MPSRLSATAFRIAADRQAAAGAAVRQHRGRRHEPQLGDVVVDAAGRARRRRRRPWRRGRTGPGSSRRAAGSGRSSVSLPNSVSSASRAVVGVDVERAVVDRLAGALGLGVRDIVAADRAAGCKIHLVSPSSGRSASACSLNVRTRCHGSKPSLNSCAAGLFRLVSPISTGHERALTEDSHLPPQPQ